MKNNSKIKLIAASVALMASFGAWAGLGGLNVQSNLGEPFSGTVTVTGEEARTLLDGGKASLSDSRLRSSVRRSGDNAVVSIRSGSAIQDPVLVFQLGVGAQSRQYTAIIDPPGYASNNQNGSRQTEQQLARESVRAAVAERGQNAAPAARARNNQPQPKATERKAAPAAAKPAPRQAAASGQYTVRAGETLTAIASRVRPGGMSTYQTVQALVQANPELFDSGNADQIWPGNVLNIPSAAELRRLHAQSRTAPVEPSETEAATPATAPETAVQETPIAAASDVPASVAAPTVEAAVSEPVAASEVATVEAASAASEAPAAATSESTDAEASAVAVPTEPAATEGGESGSWWRWLLLAGLGLLALWLLGKSRANKKKTAAEPVQPQPLAVSDEQDDSDGEFPPPHTPSEAAIRTHQPAARPSNSAPLTRAEAAATLTAAKAATQTKAKPAVDELEVEDDFEDDIFFTEVKVADAEKAGDNIRFDLGEIDSQQSAILSGAVTRDEETQKRQDADWEQIESTESVYEPEDNRFQHIAASTEAAADKPAAEAETETTWDAVAEPAALQDEAPQPKQELAPLEFDAPIAASDEAPQAAATVAETPWQNLATDGAIDVQESEELRADSAVETIEWDDSISIDDSSIAATSTSRESSGFLSESVGMTAPLEAKYELAKMYMEIGDPEAARDTLHELLEESDGNILAKAEALLKELNA